MRLTINQAEERAESRENRNGFINQFYLLDDGDTAIVKFLLNDVSDIEVHSVHMVRMTSKNGKSYPVQVDCLGDNCPLCREAQYHKEEKFPLVSRVRDNIYIPLIRCYNDKEEFDPVYEVFVRSTNYYRSTLVGYNKRNDISKLIEIERQGKRGDTRVTYALYEAHKDADGKDVTTKDSKLFEIATKSVEELKKDFEVGADDICGRGDSIVRFWTPEQVEMFLENPSVYPSINKENKDMTEETQEPQKEAVKPRRKSNHGF